MEAFPKANRVRAMIDLFESGRKEETTVRLNKPLSKSFSGLTNLEAKITSNSYNNQDVLYDLERRLESHVLRVQSYRNYTKEAHILFQEELIGILSSLANIETNNSNAIMYKKRNLIKSIRVKFDELTKKLPNDPIDNNLRDNNNFTYKPFYSNPSKPVLVGGTLKAPKVLATLQQKKREPKVNDKALIMEGIKSSQTTDNIPYISRAVKEGEVKRIEYTKYNPEEIQRVPHHLKITRQNDIKLSAIANEKSSDISPVIPELIEDTLSITNRGTSELPFSKSGDITSNRQTMIAEDFVGTKHFFGRGEFSSNETPYITESGSEATKSSLKYRSDLGSPKIIGSTLHSPEEAPVDTPQMIAGTSDVLELSDAYGSSKPVPVGINLHLHEFGNTTPDSQLYTETLDSPDLDTNIHSSSLNKISHKDSIQSVNILKRLFEPKTAEIPTPDEEKSPDAKTVERNYLWDYFRKLRRSSKNVDNDNIPERSISIPEKDDKVLAERETEQVLLSRTLSRQDSEIQESNTPVFRAEVSDTEFALGEHENREANNIDETCSISSGNSIYADAVE